MSDIRKKRIKKYRDMKARWGRDHVAMVVSSECNEVGYADDFGSPYTGEAGYSERFRVIWSDGSMTLCCLKGMSPDMPNKNALGKFLRWRIL